MPFKHNGKEYYNKQDYLNALRGVTTTTKPSTTTTSYIPVGPPPREKTPMPRAERPRSEEKVAAKDHKRTKPKKAPPRAKKDIPVNPKPAIDKIKKGAAKRYKEIDKIN